MNPESQSRFPLLFKTLEVTIIFFIFTLININSFTHFRQFPEVDNYSDGESAYILTAVIIMILMMYSLFRSRSLATYVSAWKQEKLLLLFLAYALLSVFWTVYTPATIYKLFWLFFSTIAGSYIVIRYKLRGTINLLSWVGAIILIVSILLIVNLPFLGMMQRDRFAGSWNGIFWHRNHAGNIFAFINMIFLLRSLLDNEATEKQKLIFALLYFLSAIMVFGSRSATGIIVFLFLNFVVALTIFWLKFHERIKAWHYYASASILLGSFLIFITNLGFFFGLLGRTADMTGRVPIWVDLFQNVYLQRPLFGYGYGALWNQKSFRILMQIRNNWSSQVYFADNGFFDILLNLGLVGLLMFLGIYLPLGVRSFKQAIVSKSWLFFFPFLTVLYIFIGNLAYSFLLEVDQLVWMLLVIMVFLTTAPNSNKIPQP